MSVSSVSGNSADLYKLLQTAALQQSERGGNTAAAGSPVDADGDHDGSTAQDAAAEASSRLDTKG